MFARTCIRDGASATTWDSQSDFRMLTWSRPQARLENIWISPSDFRILTWPRPQRRLETHMDFTSGFGGDCFGGRTATCLYLLRVAPGYCFLVDAAQLEIARRWSSVAFAYMFCPCFSKPLWNGCRRRCPQDGPGISRRQRLMDFENRFSDPAIIFATF